MVDRAWSSRLRHDYGLTPGDYKALLIKQNNVCAVCMKPPDKGRLHVDHNHINDKVRGLLCLNCNTLLGHAHDDIKVLLNAVAYLEKHYDPDSDVDLFVEKIKACGI